MFGKSFKTVDVFLCYLYDFIDIVPSICYGRLLGIAFTQSTQGFPPLSFV